MEFSSNLESITNGIRLAVAPVFLLTAVSGMIGVVVGRLARIIDRARVVENDVRGSDDAGFRGRALEELRQLRLRGHLSNAAIALLTACAMMIGLTILSLFLGETTLFQGAHWAVASFLLGIALFLLALLSFMVEIFVATRLLDFSLLHEEGQR